MDIEQARPRLADERDRLQAIRDDFVAQGLTSESEEDSLAELSSVDQHQADVGTETFHREADFSLLERVEAELADEERALQRLDDGTYGICEDCVKHISEDQLESHTTVQYIL